MVSAFLNNGNVRNSGFYFFNLFKGVEQKANQVIAASEETHLEPFKQKMESFFVQGIFVCYWFSSCRYKS